MPVELEQETDDNSFMTPVEEGADASLAGEGENVAAEPTVPPVKKDAVEPVVDEETTEEPDVDLWEGVQPPVKDTKGKQDVPPKKQPDRFEYQQSRADKAEAAVRERDERIRALELALTDPTIVAKLAAAKEQTPPEDTSVRPTRPTKPANYDAIEAVTDPTSESAKYRFAMDEFNDDLAEYNEKKAEISARHDAVLQTQAAEKAKVQKQMNDLATKLKTEYKFNDSEVQDFVRTVTSDEAMQLDNLVRFYQVTKASRHPNTRKIVPKSPLMREPLPLSVLGGAPSEVLDEQDEFNRSLYLRNKKMPKKI